MDLSIPVLLSTHFADYRFRMQLGARMGVVSKAPWSANNDNIKHTNASLCLKCSKTNYFRQAWDGFWLASHKLGPLLFVVACYRKLSSEVVAVPPFPWPMKSTYKRRVDATSTALIFCACLQTSITLLGYFSLTHLSSLSPSFVPMLCHTFIIAYKRAASLVSMIALNLFIHCFC